MPAGTDFQIRPWIYGVAALAHIPMFHDYAGNAWNRGHYQFFPLLIGVVAWLTWDRVAELNAARRDRHTITAIWLLAGSLASLTLSALFYSPFLIIPSLMLLTASFVLGRYGWAGLRSVIPVLLLLVFVIPGPGGYDIQLIQSMQFLASRLASWILDALGQIHFREGVILITETNQYMTEEACSGIRSLFSSLAAIAVYGVVNRYPWWRHSFNLLQTTLWVLAGNAIRVAIVVYAAEHWTPAVAEGTNHEMLGLGVFVLIFLLSLSTDRAIGVLRVKSQDESLALDDYPYPTTLDSTAVAADVDDGLPKDASHWPAYRAVQWSLIVLFVAVGLFSARLHYLRELSGQPLHARLPDVIPVPVEALPGNLNGWQLAHFNYESRDESSLLAPESWLWKLRKENQHVTISLDGPYSEFHHLKHCYRGIGWDVEVQEEYADLANGLSDGLNGSILNMEKNGEYGLVLFSAHDDSGALIPPTPVALSVNRRRNDLVNNVRQVFGLGDPEMDSITQNHRLPVSQIQVLHQSGSPVTDEQRNELRLLFTVARDQLLNSARFQKNGGPTE